MGEVSGQLAAATFDRLNTEAPGSARVQQLQGETLEAQERRSEAEAAYEAAVKLDPNLLEAVLALAKLKRIRLASDDAMPLVPSRRNTFAPRSTPPTASVSASRPCRRTRKRSSTSATPSHGTRVPRSAGRASATRSSRPGRWRRASRP